MADSKSTLAAPASSSKRSRSEYENGGDDTQPSANDPGRVEGLQ